MSILTELMGVSGGGLRGGADYIFMTNHAPNTPLSEGGNLEKL